MSRKEFFIVAFIVVYTYLAIIFQINLKNFLSHHENRNDNNQISFNAFR